MVKKVSYAGVFTAVITVLTMGSVPIGIGGGYVHIGDSIIFLCCFIMPLPYCAIAAGVGSAFADLILGFTAYALPTLLIKMLMAVIVRLFLGRNDSVAACVVSFIVASLFMQAGYLLFNFLYYGEKAGIVLILINLTQTVASIPVAYLLIKAVKRVPDLESVRKEWRNEYKGDR
ncbi:MAG: ECF transporter S component [Christensenellales bacterium]